MKNNSFLNLCRIFTCDPCSTIAIVLIYSIEACPLCKTRLMARTFRKVYGNEPDSKLDNAKQMMSQETKETDNASPMAAAENASVSDRAKATHSVEKAWPPATSHSADEIVHDAGAVVNKMSESAPIAKQSMRGPRVHLKLLDKLPNYTPTVQSGEFAIAAEKNDNEIPTNEPHIVIPIENAMPIKSFAPTENAIPIESVNNAPRNNMVIEVAAGLSRDCVDENVDKENREPIQRDMANAVSSENLKAKRVARALLDHPKCVERRSARFSKSVIRLNYGQIQCCVCKKSFRRDISAIQCDDGNTVCSAKCINKSAQ